jgi:hypothetical protein
VTEAGSAREVRKRANYLREGLKTARRLYAGLTPARGFDARSLKHWPNARVEVLSQLITSAHRLTAGEFHELYTVVYPRTADQVAALQLHTTQVSPDPRYPQKGWVVHANVRGARVRYIPERVVIGAAMGRPIYEERLRAEVVRPVKGGVLLHRDYLFREVLGFQPGADSTTAEGKRLGAMLKSFDPWVQMVHAMRLLMKRIPKRTSTGEEAYYRLLTDRGPTGTSVPAHMLIERMQRWSERYDKSFVEFLIGVRYTGSEFKARIQGRKTIERRQRYERLQKQLRLERSRIARTGHLGPKSKPKPKAKRKRVAAPKKKAFKKKSPARKK